MAKTILIIDDEVDILKTLAYRFRKRGYTVATAENGLSALESLKDLTPDLILLDYRMPDLDGVEVCRRIRKFDHLKKVPIIFFTASPFEFQREDLAHMQAQDSINKLADFSRLLDLVRRYTES